MSLRKRKNGGKGSSSPRKQSDRTASSWRRRGFGNFSWSIRQEKEGTERLLYKKKKGSLPGFEEAWVCAAKKKKRVLLNQLKL